MTRLPAPPLPRWLAAMIPFDRYCVSVAGFTLHVMEAGSGFPVLMLHGNPAWSFLYRKVAAELHGAPLRLVMPDLLGLGFSEKPAASAHRLELHAQVIRALLDGLELERLVFVGHDWGGPIGGCALAERPEQLAGAVILNTVLGPPRPGFHPTAFHRFARLPVVSDLAFRVGHFPQRGMWLAQGDKLSIRGREARAYRYPLRGLERNVAPLALARMVPDTFDHLSVEPLRRCEALFAAFKGPAAIVWGDRDPVLGKVRGRIERLLPQATVTRTPAGHFLQEEVPRDIASAIRQVAAAAQG